MATRNQKVVLRKRPDGRPTPECFGVEAEEVGPVTEGQVLVAVECLAVDAFIRTALEEVSHHASTPIGGTLTAFGVGQVVESGVEHLAPGDSVVGAVGAQTHALIPTTGLQKIDTASVPATAYLGALGLTTGVTAFLGVRRVGAVKRGETVVVSAAAGAVGCMAAQIAKLDGARVIGIAGGAAKCSFLTDDLGLDGAVDYKADDVAGQLRALAPDGIDVYFDNVGGELLDVVLDQIREQARVVICGAISQYDNMSDVRGPSLYLRLAERNARMEGFAVTHFAEHFGEAYGQLMNWLEAGRIRMPEHVVHGIERFPDALIGMFRGENLGKLLVRIA